MPEPGPVAKRAVVFYSGRVQGVGFRVTVRQIACGYDVTGTVRNLADGRVEVVAEGAAVELEAFFEGIDATGLSDFIASKTVKWENAKGGLRGFTIGH